ncbi:hypothetical protein CJF30_00002889 [Rutstroemia sp. NJR-2017a BBW]|nr:hypothetical protein CJF30_00002889 [Rutstroemia sp. NJR-2017a BBW]
MAGGSNHTPLAMDPALVKFSNMSVNRHKYFRWTGRTARITFLYAVFVPTLLGIVAFKTEGKWEMRGKRRGDTISEF